ncbi:MAG TPA: SDR family NAD(P)-dependent oxidoreductase, partial [Chitinophagaceae bacterium]|nr:SDR family NAD(P)-dependent oxidoreductase [Chitinophagaceae bacterium]
MDLKLKDKIMLVTGGAKGIGLGIAKTLAAEGSQVVIIGRNEADNIAAVSEIKKTGEKATHLVAELSIPQQCDQAVEQAVKQFGR